MDKNAIKKYAVWARRELIEKVSQKAMQFGIEDKKELDPDLESINGILLSEEEKKQRQALVRRITLDGYSQVIEEVAYTWFNRFIALRFMEVNGYLPSHVRVFTDENNEFKPQIMVEALHLEFSCIDKSVVIDLKQSNRDDELFKYLLIGQCNELSSILPGMFQRISDYTELLLPDYLLRSGSVIEQMIHNIPEEDWKEQVQIIGWLYQDYNTEPKDIVFAELKKNKKITKDKIPAATQIFTPEWVVKYMVENSLGRFYKNNSTDKEQFNNWKYYIDDDNDSSDKKILDPSQIKCIDPCMGSGHILCYMFDVLVEIYEAYGFSARDAASSIVENNLFGLDIDDRAAQLAYFAVMMKARQYDRRFFTRNIQPNVLVIRESNSIDRDALNYFCNNDSQLSESVSTLCQELQDAKTFGSAIRTKDIDLAIIMHRIEEVSNDISIYKSYVESEIIPMLKAGMIMTDKYDVVVTNPPYMGINGMDLKLADFCKDNYETSKSDLCTVDGKIIGYA